MNKAQERAGKEAVSPNFVQKDMRKLDLNKKFQAAFILGNSFGYFDDEDNEKVIKNASKVLEKGGYFILDLPNTIDLLRHEVGGEARKEKIPNGHILTEDKSLNPLNLTLKLKWTIVKDDKKRSYEGKLRLYTFPEISILLNRYQFEIKEVFGSFQSEDYGLETPRMIVVCKKNKQVCQ